MERVQKLLAQAGFGSRRACEELVARGRVRVNGVKAELGSKATTEDKITVDGAPVEVSGKRVYYILNKPTGVLTTSSDPSGRTTVTEIVPDTPRVFPVGRLDRETSGLLFLTNDGEFAQRIAHPSYSVPKTYLAECTGVAGPKHASRLRRGVELEDGLAKATHVRLGGIKGGRSVVELTVKQGRNRIVRRMLEAVGLPVVSLVRVSVGPVTLGRLRPGTWRKLSPAEIHSLLTS